MKDKEDRIITDILNDGGIGVEEKESKIHALLKQKLQKPGEANKPLTFGQRVADKMASVAGSWPFIIIFCVILACWIALNVLMAVRAFDPYPFILLNLALSCLAAIQAPIIMMSQNRQNEKDRAKADSDYRVNLKSEIILEDLHQKIDLLLKNQEEIKKQIGAKKG